MLSVSPTHTGRPHTPLYEPRHSAPLQRALEKKKKKKKKKPHTGNPLILTLATSEVTKLQNTENQYKIRIPCFNFELGLRRPLLKTPRCRRELDGQLSSRSQHSSGQRASIECAFNSPLCGSGFGYLRRCNVQSMNFLSVPRADAVQTMCSSFIQYLSI